MSCHWCQKSLPCTILIFRSRPCPEFESEMARDQWSWGLSSGPCDTKTTWQGSLLLLESGAGIRRAPTPWFWQVHISIMWHDVCLHAFFIAIGVPVVAHGILTWLVSSVQQLAIGSCTRYTNIVNNKQIIKEAAWNETELACHVHIRSKQR